MSNDPKRDEAVAKLERGLGFLSKSDWYELQTFALMSMNVNPRTVKLMAAALKMTPPAKDPEKWNPEQGENWDADFTKTAKDYDKLGKTCDGFWNKTKPGMVELANDIVQYARKTDVYYGKLIGIVDAFNVGGDIKANVEALWNEWQLPTPSTGAGNVRKNFVSALTVLRDDADAKSRKAGELETEINQFHADLMASERTFDTSARSYEEKYGAKSADMQKLQITFDRLKSELEVSQKKESDEVIVLSSSPLYLLLWPFGVFIMAAVQVGVGVDLALTRKKIDELVAAVKLQQDKMNAKSLFKASYDFIKAYTRSTSTQIKAILPAVVALKDGWGTIASELKCVITTLDESGKQLNREQWFNFSGDLETARETWKFLSKRADNFRLNATVREVPNANELVKGAAA